MDHDTLPAIGDPDDALARNRLAAAGATEGLVGGQADHGAAGIDLFGRRRGGKLGIDRLDHLARGQFGAADAGQYFVFVGKAERLRRGPQRLVRHLAPVMLERHPRQFAPELDEPFAVLLAQ